MYLAQILLLSCMLHGINAGTYFGKILQGIANISSHPIPSSTICTNVDFRDNSISHIPANFFKDLPNLDKIRLDSNVISSIEDNAYVAVPSVTDINIQNNKLQVIKKHMFSGLHNLQKLWLGFNDIHTIEPLSFKDNRALTFLDLVSNALDTLQYQIFDPCNHPVALNDVRLRDNPLSCNSSLCWLKRLDGSWITVSHSWLTSCSGGALDGRKWNMLTDQDLGCDDPSVASFGEWTPKNENVETESEPGQIKTGQARSLFACAMNCNKCRSFTYNALGDGTGNLGECQIQLKKCESSNNKKGTTTKRIYQYNKP